MVGLFGLFFSQTDAVDFNRLAWVDAFQSTRLHDNGWCNPFPGSGLKSRLTECCDVHARLSVVFSRCKRPTFLDLDTAWATTTRMGCDGQNRNSQERVLQMNSKK